jgi:drug/metabolite transporter (DMT)-like permease
VVMALAVAHYVFGQKITRRQMIGMAVMMAGVALLLRNQ